MRHHAVLGKNQETLSWNPVASGVPQSSILGPLLFLVFIDNIRHQIKYSKWLLYAGDLQICIHTETNNIQDALLKLDTNIILVFDWALENKLILNFKKLKQLLSETRMR